jgi:preprotein translocase subunit SecE
LADKDKRGKAQNGVQLFFRETTGELRKVSWPTWPEARRLTILVLIVMVLMGAYLFFVDHAAGWFLNLLLGI